MNYYSNSGSRGGATTLPVGAADNKKKPEGHMWTCLQACWGSLDHFSWDNRVMEWWLRADKIETGFLGGAVAGYQFVQVTEITGGHGPGTDIHQVVT